MEEKAEKPTVGAEEMIEDRDPAGEGDAGKPFKITVPPEAGLKAVVVGGSKMPE